MLCRTEFWRAAICGLLVVSSGPVAGQVLQQPHVGGGGPDACSWQMGGTGLWTGCNVGIGTPNPAFPLHVVSNSGAGGRAVYGLNYGGAGAAYGVVGQATGAGGVGVFGVASGSDGTTYGVLGRANSPGGYAGAFLGRGFFTGSVGIGISQPTAMLHIGGTAGMDGIRFPDGTLQTTAAGGTLGGDLSGTVSDARIEKIQGNAVSAVGPNPGDLLMWTGAQWIPTDGYLMVARSSAGGAPVSTFTGRLDVQRASGQQMMNFRDEGGVRLGWLRMTQDSNLQLAADSRILSISSDSYVQVTNTAATALRPICASAFNNCSSAAFKDDIVQVTQQERNQWLEKLAGLNPATYYLKGESGDGANNSAGARRRHLGFIAEELPPALVSPDGKAVDLYALTTSVAVALQALKARADEQAATIQSLRGEVAGLRAQLQRYGPGPIE